MREALRLLEARRQEEAAKRERLRAAVQVGVDALDSGEYDEVPFDKIDEYISNIGRRAGERAKKARG